MLIVKGSKIKRESPSEPSNTIKKVKFSLRFSTLNRMVNWNLNLKDRDSIRWQGVVSVDALQKAWSFNRLVSKDDWLEWLRRLSIELMKSSPSPALRWALYCLAPSQRKLYFVYRKSQENYWQLSLSSIGMPHDTSFRCWSRARQKTFVRLWEVGRNDWISSPICWFFYGRLNLGLLRCDRSL